MYSPVRTAARGSRPVRPRCGVRTRDALTILPNACKTSGTQPRGRPQPKRKARGGGGGARGHPVLGGRGRFAPYLAVRRAAPVRHARKGLREATTDARSPRGNNGRRPSWWSADSLLEMLDAGCRIPHLSQWMEGEAARRQTYVAANPSSDAKNPPESRPTPPREPEET